MIELNKKEEIERKKLARLEEMTFKEWFRLQCLANRSVPNEDGRGKYYFRGLKT